MVIPNFLNIIILAGDIMTSVHTTLTYGKERIHELCDLFKIDEPCLQQLEFTNIDVNKALTVQEHLLLFSEITRTISGPWIFSKYIMDDPFSILNEISLFYICASHHMSFEKHAADNPQKAFLLSRADKFFSFKKTYLNEKDPFIFKELLTATTLEPKYITSFKSIINKLLLQISTDNEDSLSYDSHVHQKLLREIQTEPDLQDASNQLISLAERHLVRFMIMRAIMATQENDQRSIYLQMLLKDQTFMEKLLGKTFTDQNLLLRALSPTAIDILGSDIYIQSNFYIIFYLGFRQENWTNSRAAREFILECLQNITAFDCIPNLNKHLAIIKKRFNEATFFSSKNHRLSDKFHDKAISDASAMQLGKYVNGELSTDYNFKITQKDLAEMIGLSQPGIRKILKGENTSVNSKTLAEINKKTGLPISFLLGESDNPFIHENGLIQPFIKIPIPKKKD